MFVERHSRPFRRGRQWLLLAALFAPTGAVWAKDTNVRFYAETRAEPRRFYFFHYRACHNNWVNDQVGCLAWVQRNRGRNVPEWPLGSQDLLQNTHFYVLPVCASGLRWSNNSLGLARGEAMSVLVECRGR